MVSPFGKNTTLVEMPIIGKFSSARIKCEDAPESRIIVDAFV